ncbi:hypothetical protein NDU88_000621 [Pleurodeles waltl]|uniref:Receptor ligand binding region domain-containing protein n=1 Tax=Pleurodeles waltl TaxID=8319 RepID=A0AAV7KQE2_PLEWA|nr:hypothetical protein NDU88_000621 [Pleurodeles waltl]
MVFAIEQINETPDILPNITLGFQIYDSCTMLQLVLQETLQILTGKEEFLPNYRCQQHLPLAGIVGDAGSSNSILVARVLGLYGYPQISYFSTSPLLSDRSQFPSFFRTIPSDDFQSRGLAQLLLHFGWTWVGLLATDNDYGKLGVQIIRQELLKAGACVAFSESIITNRLDKNAFHIAKVTKASSAMVIIVFSSEASLVPVMDEMVRQNVIGKTWIASESWSTSALLSTARYQKVLIGLIGFATYSGEMLGFEEHLTSMRPSKFSEGLFIKEFWEIIFNCSWLDNNTLPSLSESRNGRCTGDEKLTMLDGIFNELSNPRVTYNVYSAVYAIALALHDLNTCTSINGSFVCATCVEIRDFQPWQNLATPYGDQGARSCVLALILLFPRGSSPPLDYQDTPLHWEWEPGSALPTDKSNGKPACQLLFSEALAHQGPGPHQQLPHVTEAPDAHTGTQPDSTMDHILQEITAVGKRLEGMDTKISELTAESRSLCIDIPRFKARVMGHDHRLSLVEDKLN